MGGLQGGKERDPGGSLLGYQKRFAGLVAGIRGRYHSRPLLFASGMLEIGDLYRQQLRVHAWQFWNGRLPVGQAAMLGRVADVHRYGTRSAGAGLHVSSRDHASVGYRVPKEWATLTEGQRGMGSLAGFKRESRAGFLRGYGGFVCTVRGCYVCGREEARRGAGQESHNAEDVIEGGGAAGGEEV